MDMKRMVAHKLGRDLLRCTALLRGDRLLRQNCSFPGLGSELLASRAQLHAGLSCFSSAAQTGRSPAGYRGNAVRFYSQDGTGWQGLRGSAGSSLSSHDPGYAMDIPSPPEASAAAALAETTGNARVPFSVHLKECHSPADVLDLAGRHAMTMRNVSSSLSRMWETVKKMSEEQRRYELRLMLEHPAFEQLCAHAAHCAARMRSEDLTFSLLAVVKLGVPQHSRLVQTFLRAAQEKLNEFDEKALSVLAAFLVDMKSCKNVDALREGLRMVLEDQVLGIKRVMALQNLMRCVGRDAPLPLKKKLEMKALSMVDQFSLPNTQYMIITLAAMDFTSKPLLDICSKIIAESIHTIPPFRLMSILKACKDLRYRDTHLLSAVGEHLTSTFDMWSNKQLILFLLMFEELRFRPVALLDRFLEKVIQDPNSLTLKDVLSVLKVYSQLNHIDENRKREFLERMTRVLESYLLKMSPKDLLRGVFLLCMLGHFPFASLERLLRQETLDELAKVDRFLQTNQRRLHFVDLCLKLDCPPLPEALSLPAGTVDPPLIGQTVTRDWGKLIHGIVGDAVSQEGVVLEKTYYIDCVLSLPLRRTDPSSLPEGECISPEPCQRVAVLFAPPSFFCFGTSHPRGRLVMMMRHLRALGYTPVLVPEQEFEALSEEERMERLRILIFPPIEEEGAAAAGRPAE